MATILPVIQIFRGDRIILDFAVGFQGGPTDGHVGVVDHDFLAKGIDELTRTTRDAKLIGVGICKADSVSYFVTPYAGRGGDQNGIIYPGFYVFEWDRTGIGIFIFTHGDEFIENPVIQE